MKREEILRKVANGESLKGAYLREADLYGANLRRADLRRADLYGANLREADLYGANLRGADLRRADLHRANLREADLYGANLRDADLRRADLHGANLHDADLRRADLYGANLGDEKSTTRQYIESTTLVPPEIGAFQAWKALAGGHIALLQVPEDAIRYSATTRKCRVSKAIVLKIFDRNGDEVSGPIPSIYTVSFLYAVGATVEPTAPFAMDRWNECSSGIHCFLTRYEAETFV